jgi:hypothetical protein
MRNGGFIHLQKLRELGERLGGEITVTAQFIICRKQAMLTALLSGDYAE